MLQHCEREFSNATQTIKLLNQQNKEATITFDINDGHPQGTIVKISIPINYTFETQN
jgi:hypothetical protein